jgi:hypothetical protein
VLAHLHHTPRVRSHQRSWTRDALIAAQVGAAALVVVTALENDRPSGGATEDAAGRTPTELVQAVPAARAVPSTVAATTGADGQQSILGVAGLDDQAVPAPAAAAATTVQPPGRIEIAVLHADTTASSVAQPGSLLLGPLSVTVLDGAGAVVTTTTVQPGEVGRLERLAPGPYRLVLSSETPVTEPTPGVAIGAASSELSTTIELIDGDVLLVAAQTNGSAPAT